MKDLRRKVRHRPRIDRARISLQLRQVRCASNANGMLDVKCSAKGGEVESCIRFARDILRRYSEVPVPTLHGGYPPTGAISRRQQIEMPRGIRGPRCSREAAFHKRP
jgi:hypothetical protein